MGSGGGAGVIWREPGACFVDVRELAMRAGALAVSGRRGGVAAGRCGEDE